VIVSSWLLLVLGVLGATDILLYHSISHGIRRHPAARGELFTHFLRGPTYALLFLAVPNLELRGLWLVALLALLLVDLAISIADFWLETDSRAGLGGLPRGEYLLHVVMAMLFGGLVAAVLFESDGALSAATSVGWRQEGAPRSVRVALAIMAPLVLWTGLADLRAMRALRRAR
jgi:hypothetical protein